ncbi:MAG TPA: hypothetical protein EYQ25_02705 [Planctomycetes bacterium]|nr:hypothetical protein [Planctomycetota bacterium]HIL36320.1 hypothetical protein [Planctomycetota bacterium]
MQATIHYSLWNSLRSLLLACISLTLVAALQAQSLTPDDGRGSVYSFVTKDNLCGLKEARQLSSPAQVNYESLLESTPEVRRMRARRIAPSSAQGTRLLAAARSRILKACKRELSASGHCSVWKRISRRDGSSVDDVTSAVRKRIVQNTSH